MIQKNSADKKDKLNKNIKYLHKNKIKNLLHLISS